MPNSNDIFATVQERVSNCVRCGLRDTCKKPVPISGRPYAPILVIGEAPGEEEDKESKPFVGPSGRLLRWTFREAGINLDNVNFTNTVRCRPPKNRTPYQVEREACDLNFWLEINASKSSVLLLTGGVALSKFRNDLSIKENHSRPMLYKNWVLVPTYHPASALRNKKLTEIILEDIKQARYWTRNQASIEHPKWPKTCRRCGYEASKWDSMGVAYCYGHYRPFEPVEQGVLI